MPKVQEKQAKAVCRDVRVDRVGAIEELAKKYADPLRKEVKAGMEDGFVRTGDLYEAVLIEQQVREVDEAAWLGLWTRKKITREQFLAAIKVSPPKVAAILAEKEAARITEVSMGSPRLVISRLKSVDARRIDQAVASLFQTVEEAIR